MGNESEVLRSLGGVARWRTLQQAGVRTGVLRGAVATGTVRKVGYGVYALPEAPDELIAAVGLSGSLTCVSAAQWHGLWLRNKPSKPHVLVRKQAFSREVILHRRDAYQSLGPVVTIAEAVRQVCRCLPWEESLVVAESAVSQGKLSKSEIFASLNSETRAFFGLHLEGSAQSVRGRSAPDFALCRLFGPSSSRHPRCWRGRFGGGRPFGDRIGRLRLPQWPRRVSS